MAYELEGTIKLIDETKEYGSNGFQKREFVVTTDGEYPQDIKFELTKERCALLDNVTEGSRVSLRFNIRGNEHKGRYYVNLQAFVVNVTALAQPEPAAGVTMGPPSDDIPDDENMPF